MEERKKKIENTQKCYQELHNEKLSAAAPVSANRRSNMKFL
jgi:hypothetical protein